jgi:hypothetical protein
MFMTEYHDPFPLKLNPQNFPLHIYLCLGEEPTLVVDLPNSRWIPRVGETIILPIEEAFYGESHWGFLVNEVNYDFVLQVNEVSCIFHEQGDWSEEILLSKRRF